MEGGQVPQDELKYGQGEILNGQRTDIAGRRTTKSNELGTNRGIYPTNNAALSQSYEGRSYNGSKGWLVDTTYSLPENVKTELKTKGVDTPDFHQLQSGNDEMAGVFYNALKKAKELNPKDMASVDLHNPEEYKNMKMFLSENEDCGFVIKPDGDLISVFSYPKGQHRSYSLMHLAIEQGAKKLDCYDTYLPKLYKNFGFEEVSRAKWNEKYKPKEWDKDFYKQFNNGEPDVVYMELKEQGLSKQRELEQYKPVGKKELDNYDVTTNKNDAFGENPDITETDYEPYTMHSISDKDGNNLGHVRITNGNYIDWMSNNQSEKGAVRKLIAKLLHEGKYQSLVWDATTENSVKSYERFCKEFPDLANRIEFTNKYNKVDINMPSNYTQEKGVLKDAKGNSNNEISTRGQILSGDGTTNNTEKISGIGKNQGTNRADKSGVLYEGSPTTNERGSLTNTDNATGLQSTNGQPTQLKLDFNAAATTAKSTDELVDNLANGAAKVTDVEDVDTILNRTIELKRLLSYISKDSLLYLDKICDFNKIITKQKPQ